MINKMVLLSLIVTGILVGCAGQEESESIIEPELEPESLSIDRDRMNKEAIDNDGKDQPSEKHQEYIDRSVPQNEYPKKNTPISDPDAMSTNNKEYDKQSREIGKRLSESRYVKTAQVVVTNEKVVVAIEEPDRTTYTRVNVAEKVREILKEMPETNGKEIVVYTDERYWDRMKDLKSRLHQDEEMPNGVDQFREQTYR
ncbi:hypothetical protein GLW08_08510 [Pontibacillus yanchengensis]|uniref:Uncharacterized protein n=1 Tax=Pontibacillus yanchengensis TaxID=462910 RepID=A0ACC7VHG6_9BACI|nr:YhcN/YlaJ family sporulation lipoprotein [Pontibacillus yanchengensis]MYL53379.1 hypothetical protein [Pontibacillus yanchengensis]